MTAIVKRLHTPCQQHADRLREARERYIHAKACWTHAAQAAQAADPNAATLADAALAELNAAQRALQNLTDAARAIK